MTDMSTMGLNVGPDVMLAAAQTVGVVAYARQNIERINGALVLPACFAAAFAICFMTTPAVDLAYAQKSVGVALLAFGGMVLRRGGNSGEKGGGDGGGSEPRKPPPPRPFPSSDTSRVTSALMHVVPLLLLGVAIVPMIMRWAK